MTLRLVLALVMAALFAMPACGSLSTGKVPVDSEIKPWEAPEEDDLVAGDDDDDDDDDDSAGAADDEHEPEPESAPEGATAAGAGS